MTRRPSVKHYSDVHVYLSISAQGSVITLVHSLSCVQCDATPMKTAGKHMGVGEATRRAA